MRLEGVHFLLTYRCDIECDHCFVWGSPRSRGVFTLEQIRSILHEAKKLKTVTRISFEGGEPFLYYPIMVKAAKEAAKLGFSVEVLSNCYWASSPEDAGEWLLPFADTKDLSLSLSSDLYHGEDWEIEAVSNAVQAANSLKMKAGVISVEYPNAKTENPDTIEGAEVGLWKLMYRGRAASELAEKADKKPWREFTKCPYEDLANPTRVHIDPLGYVHVCQGISIGNAWQKPLSQIVGEYSALEHPILGPLIQGGPAELVKKFGLPHEEHYADACHLCYAARRLLRRSHPRILAPDQMYGEFG